MPLKLQCDSMASLAVYIGRFVDVKMKYSISFFDKEMQTNLCASVCPDRKEQETNFEISNSYFTINTISALLYLLIAQNVQMFEKKWIHILGILDFFALNLWGWKEKTNNEVAHKTHQKERNQEYIWNWANIFRQLWTFFHFPMSTIFMGFDNIVGLKAADIGRYWTYSRLLSQDTVWTGNIQARYKTKSWRHYHF